MPKQFLSGKEILFAPGEDTFGLSIRREVWEIGGEKRTYWKYSLPDAVQIFGITAERQVIAVSEFQPGAGTDYLHLPGETMEQGEAPLKAAARGLLEETGYEAGSVELLSSILENSGRSDRLIHVVLALNCKKSELEGEKEIETVLLQPSEFWSRLMSYLTTNPECKHGGGNTLKATALAFCKLGWLAVTHTEEGF